MLSRRRGIGAGRRNGPARPSGPYRGVFSPPYNAPSKLSVAVPAGSPNAMHPDVLDFGTAWNGYRYRMSHTPFNGDENTEVPCVVASNDITSGGTWVTPAGFTNPLTPDPAGATHMADADLCYDATSDRLYVFYIYTDDNTTFQDIRAKWTSGDGTWSSEITVLAGAAGTYANPSIIKTATGWRMYYNLNLSGIFYRDTTVDPVSGYGAESSAPLSLDYGSVVTRRFQNLNVVKDVDGAHVAVISDAAEQTGLNLDGKVFFARSEDDGATFTITGPPVLEAGPPDTWDAEGMYRASLLVDTDSTVVLDGSNVQLYYSAYRDGTTNWGIGYTQVPAQCIRF